MKVLTLRGINAGNKGPFGFNRIREHLKSFLPESRFDHHDIGGRLYSAFSFKIIGEMLQETVSEVNDCVRRGEEVLLIGSSGGGLIAESGLVEAENPELAHLATVSTPHGGFFGQRIIDWIEKAMDREDYRCRDCTRLDHTFATYGDPIAGHTSGHKEGVPFQTLVSKFNHVAFNMSITYRTEVFKALQEIWAPGTAFRTPNVLSGDNNWEPGNLVFA